jgi:hypothetical protein
MSVSLRGIPCSMLVLVLAALAASSHAQIRRRVLSESGEPVPGASVITVREGETDYLAKNKTLTGKTGKFHFATQGVLVRTTQPGSIPDFRSLARSEAPNLRALCEEPALSEIEEMGISMFLQRNTENQANSAD